MIRLQLGLPCAALYRYNLADQGLRERRQWPIRSERSVARSKAVRQESGCRCIPNHVETPRLGRDESSEVC